MTRHRNWLGLLFIGLAAWLAIAALHDLIAALAGRALPNFGWMLP